MIISGIPVDTAENRERVRSLLGVDPVVLPWPRPYLDSVPSGCQMCDLQIWIGPTVYEKMLELIAHGRDFVVFCLICCAILARDEADSVEMITLTDKKEGE